MSKYNREIKRGLAGIKGLNFAYRLNTWGPKTGPAMLPANAFSRGFTPPVGGLASPLTWVEGLFGMESAADILSDAQNTIVDINSRLSSAGITVSQLLGKAQAYDSVTGADVQAKAQACESEAAGVQANLVTLQNASQNITTQIQASSGTNDKTVAQSLKDAASSLSGQVDTFLKSVDGLNSDVNALIKYAASGPGAVQTLENAAVSSLSTLTWILGGGALVYFLAPTFIPRVIGGIRKGVRG